MSDTAQVYVVDDDDDLRGSLVDLISTRTPWRTKAYTDGRAWLDAEQMHPPGCVLLDHSMPGITGLGVLQEMQRRQSAHQIVMLTGEGNIGIAVQAMRAGATDFIEKPARFEDLERAISAAIARLTDTIHARDKAAEAKIRLARLKPREHDVMMGLVEGDPNKIIAYKLGLSVRTVELYRAALMDRLDVNSVADVLKIAFAAGLIHS
jgi:two-component system response regulator FixJ